MEDHLKALGLLLGGLGGVLILGWAVTCWPAVFGVALILAALGALYGFCYLTVVKP